MQNVQIIDLGFGNIASVKRVFMRACDKEAEIIHYPIQVKPNSIVVLPGVGSFDHAMRNLEESNWIDFIKCHEGAEDILFFGICLGMQLFFNASAEGQLNGLGICNGMLRSFSNLKDETIRPTHIGWNKTLDFTTKEAVGDFYFVHSFFAPIDKEYTLLTSTYGEDLSAAIKFKNFIGTQFHPEKSGKNGVSFIRRYLTC
jgi:imidazole glycerol-phosphate synthase subunit HisH